MNASKYRISLDVHQAHSNVCLDVKRGDNCRKIYITLTDGGFPYRISEECYAVFAAKKPDKKAVLNDCFIEGDTIIYELTGQTTATEGVLDCEVCLYGRDNQLITSPSFTLVVNERAVGDDDEIVSSDEFRALDKLLAEAIGSIKSIDASRNVDYVGVEPAEDDMPKVFITGVKPTTKDDVLAEMQYISKTDNFHAYLEIKCQGTSSMSYAKKNFTVKLYSDEARETKLKKSFKDWNHESNKFVLKANHIDHSHARNIVSARLWGEVVASRPDYDSLPVEMRNAPNNGAVDGFPIKVYYNGNYEGVYTWNIGKDDWMWGMDEDNTNHVLLCAEGNTDGVYAETTSNFRKLWDGVDGSKPGWSVEVGTNSTALKTSLNNLIQFVMDNDGDDFRNGISNYLDIQSAIDYYIFQYEICGLDGLAHNMLLATYDGKVWRCGAYDLDATFGMWWDGSKFVSAEYACPEDYQERYSLLWERIEANFGGELKARQAELRKTVLSYSNMVTHFERFMDIIGLDLYAEDLTIYTAIPSGSTNNIKQIRDYIRDRQIYVDAEFAAMEGEIPDNPDPTDTPCTGITLSANSLTFTEVGTQTLTATVTPDGCTDTISWNSNNTSVATVNGGVVTAVTDGDCVITATCGNYSASCNVSVSLPKVDTGVDYSVDGLSGANWTTGQTYAKNTGVLTSTTGEHASDKVVLQTSLYKVVNGTGGTYPAIFLWDENDNYQVGVEDGAGDLFKSIVVCGSPYTKFAAKVYSAEGVDYSAFTVTPIDNSRNSQQYKKINLANYTFAKSGYVYETQINADDLPIGFAANANSIDYSGVTSIVSNSASIILAPNWSANIVNNPTYAGKPLLWIRAYNGNVLVQTVGFTSADAINSYMAENDVYIEFNVHLKDSE